MALLGLWVLIRYYARRPYRVLSRGFDYHMSLLRGLITQDAHSAIWADVPFTIWAYGGLQKSVLIYTCAVGGAILGVMSIYGGHKLPWPVDGVKIRLNQPVGE